MFRSSSKTITISRPRRLRRSNYSLTAFSLGLTSFVIAFSFSAVGAPRAPELPPGEPPVRIVGEDDLILIPTPARQIAKGERLQDTPFIEVKWPKSRLSSEYMTDLETLRASYASTPLPKFLPVPSSAIRSVPFDSNVVVEGIPSGMRAITVRVDAESAVEGWARTGSFVDVILVRADRERPGALDTQVIAENIRILSADRSAEPGAMEEPGSTAPATVTLLTSQEDALRIKSAVSLGRLTFALRGEGDAGPTLARELDFRALGSREAIHPTEARVESRTGFARDSEGRIFVLRKAGRWSRLLDNDHPFAIGTHASVEDNHEDKS